MFLFKFFRLKLIWLVGKVHDMQYWLGRDRSVDIDSINGMTSMGERLYYMHIASKKKGEPGAIVDLGCWLGSTTLSLCKGLEKDSKLKSDRDIEKVYAYDQFVWEGWMDFMLPYMKRRFKDGQSFMSLTKSNLKNYSKTVVLVKANLCDYKWRNGLIKILLVDAMKNIELAQQITSNFYPYLESGSVVIHQDFKHGHTWWIHLIQHRLRHSFEFEHEVTDGFTVTFRCLESCSKSKLKQATAFFNLSKDDIDAAFNYSSSLVSLRGQRFIADAHILCYQHYSLSLSEPVKNFTNDI